MSQHHLELHRTAVWCWHCLELALQGWGRQLSQLSVAGRPSTFGLSSSGSFCFLLARSALQGELEPFEPDYQRTDTTRTLCTS
eukprot:3884863-Amphidinium_carterae.1